MSSRGVKLLSVGQNINQQAQRSNCTGTKNNSHASYYGHMLDCYMVDLSFQNLFSLAVHTLKIKKCSLVQILNYRLNSNRINEFVPGVRSSVEMCKMCGIWHLQYLLVTLKCMLVIVSDI